MRYDKVKLLPTEAIDVAIALRIKYPRRTALMPIFLFIYRTNKHRYDATIYKNVRHRKSREAEYLECRFSTNYVCKYLRMDRTRFYKNLKFLRDIGLLERRGRKDSLFLNPLKALEFLDSTRSDNSHTRTEVGSSDPNTTNTLDGCITNTTSSSDSHTAGDPYHEGREDNEEQTVVLQCSSKKSMYSSKEISEPLKRKQNHRGELHRLMCGAEHELTPGIVAFLVDNEIIVETEELWDIVDSYLLHCDKSRVDRTRVSQPDYKADENELSIRNKFRRKDGLAPYPRGSLKGFTTFIDVACSSIEEEDLDEIVDFWVEQRVSKFHLKVVGYTRQWFKRNLGKEIDAIVFLWVITLHVNECDYGLQLSANREPAPPEQQEENRKYVITLYEPGDDVGVRI